MVREDTGALTKGATCAWMVTDEAVGCTRAFLTMGRSYSTTGLSRPSLAWSSGAEQAKFVSTVQQEKLAYYHNLRSSDKVFKVGEKVIVLIPDATSKLFARWQGPATIIEKRNPHSFLVEMPDNSTKHIHQNKLRHYVASSNSVNVIFEEEKEFGQVETLPTATEESKFYEVLSNLKTDNLNSYNLKVLKNLIS
ncbi:uncharacterized protein TNCV_4027561 [Trichonephila clavipes]|nr:uncharacterized protein TNCV_4027561 [Trichonephila clavipes]